LRHALVRLLIYLQGTLTTYPLLLLALSYAFALRASTLVGKWVPHSQCHCQLNTFFPRVDYDPWYTFWNGFVPRSFGATLLPAFHLWLLLLLLGWRLYTPRQRGLFVTVYAAGWLLLVLEPGRAFLWWFYD
jgi:hypothetical protein